MKVTTSTKLSNNLYKIGVEPATASFVRFEDNGKSFHKQTTLLPLTKDLLERGNVMLTPAWTATDLLAIMPTTINAKSGQLAGDRLMLTIRKYFDEEYGYDQYEVSYENPDGVQFICYEEKSIAEALGEVLYCLLHVGDILKGDLRYDNGDNTQGR